MADQSPDTSTVGVVSTDGEIEGVPKAQVPDILRSGAYRVASQSELDAYWQHQDYGGTGSALGAAGEGALNALTFGTGTAALRAAGLTTEEGEKGRAAEHPTAHMLGTGAGIIAPLVLSGGAAAPLEGAEAASGALTAARGLADLTAPALIGRAGKAVGALTKGAGLPGVLGKFAPTIAAGAVEGASYAGSDVTEKALLGDPQLTWEKAASEMGLGALFGGSLAGGTQLAANGLGTLMQKATAGLESVGSLMARGDPVIMQQMLKQKGSLEALEKVSEGAIGKISASTPATADFILKHTDRIAKLEREFPGITDVLSKATPASGQDILDNWGKLLKDPETRIAVGHSLSEAVNSAYKSIDGALKTFGKEVRPGEVEFLLHPDVAELAGTHATPAMAQAEASRMTARVAEAASMMRAEPELHMQNVARELELIGEGFAKDATTNASSADIFNLLNRTKQTVDTLADFGRKIPPEARRTVSIVRSLRGELKDSLENSSLWGPVADRQAALNKAQNMYFTAAKRMTYGKQKLMSEVTLPNGNVTYEADPSAINTWVNLMGDQRGAARTDKFASYLHASKNLAEEMERSGLPNAGEVRQAIERSAANAEEIRQRGTITQLVKTLQDRPMMSSGPALPMGTSAALKAARYIPGGVGHLIGLGTDAAGTLQKIREPAAMVGVLSTLEKLSKKASGKLNAAAEGLFSTGAGGAASGIAAQKFATGGIVGQGAFSAVSGHIRDLGGSLGKLSAQVGKETAGMSTHAPATADAARAFAARVVQHLGSKLPDPGERKFLDPPFKPTVNDLASFNRHKEVAERGPVALLEHAARGTLHADHLETSQALFPKLHAETQETLMQAMGEHVQSGKRVPDRLRGALGRILGADLDHSRTPQAVLAAQRTYTAAQAPGMQAAPGGKSRDVKTSLSAATATPSQKNEVDLSKP